MQAWEYKTVEVRWTGTWAKVDGSKGGLIRPAFERNILSTSSDERTAEAKREVDRLGREGWELVGMVPYDEGYTDWDQSVQRSYGLGLSIIVGYIMWLKRPLNS